MGIVMVTCPVTAKRLSTGIETEADVLKQFASACGPRPGGDRLRVVRWHGSSHLSGLVSVAPVHQMPDVDRAPHDCHGPLKLADNAA